MAINWRACSWAGRCIAGGLVPGQTCIESRSADGVANSVSVVMADLPTFRYHPDPLATGAIQPSEEECICCGEARGFIYTGPIYAEEDLDDSFCPWCIADGSAAEKFDATFTDLDALCFAKLPREVTEEVANRTP